MGFYPFFSPTRQVVGSLNFIRALPSSSSASSSSASSSASSPSSVTPPFNECHLPFCRLLYPKLGIRKGLSALTPFQKTQRPISEGRASRRYPRLWASGGLPALPDKTLSEVLWKNSLGPRRLLLAYIKKTARATRGILPKKILCGRCRSQRRDGHC